MPLGGEFLQEESGQLEGGSEQKSQKGSEVRVQNSFGAMDIKSKKVHPQNNPGDETFGHVNMSAENDLTRQDSQPSIFKEVVKSYPAYLLTSLIDIVMDQMKEESSEFKKFISIAADAYDSKQLFLNFVKNDPNFEQSVDRENFIRTLNQNEAMLEYMDQYDSGYQF